MAQHPRHKPRSAKQVKASQKAAAAGRRSQHQARVAAILKTGKPPPRSGKQQAASRAAASAGRAAQAARRAGKTPVSHKKAAAPLDTGSPLDQLPACAPAALAGHLHAMTGILVPDEEILALHELVRQVRLGDLLEHVAAEGFGGMRLRSFQPCDPDLTVPGLIYGVQLPWGYHAVVSHPYGMISWGTLWPLLGTPEEAWHLEWEAE